MGRFGKVTDRGEIAGMALILVEAEPIRADGWSGDGRWG